MLRKNNKFKLIPLLFLIITYPLGDAIFTDPQSTQHTFPLFPAIIIVPFATFYILDSLNNIKHKSIVFFFLIFTLFLFFDSLYTKNKYLYCPKVSSDYWGWQYCFKEAMIKLNLYKNDYDELSITYMFNEPQSLLAFYNIQHLCDACHINLEININKKELFALRKGDISNLLNDNPSFDFITKDVIYNPNGSPELYIGSFYERIR